MVELSAQVEIRSPHSLREGAAESVVGVVSVL